MTEASAPSLDQLSPLQRAALTIKQLRGRLSAYEQAEAEPIAVVGMGCRFPGAADTPDAFWDLLHEGREAIGEIPPDRWDTDTYFDPDPAAAGRIYVRRGYFLRDVDRFDPGFFGLSPREAVSLDPQHRLLLEVSWEALEDAGQPTARLAGSRTGVFVGIGQNDYAQLQLFAGDPTRIDTYDGTGNGFCFSSGRLAHILRLQGPNLAVDTACSSSLVAVHLACQSLRSRECDMALAGGVQLILSPEVTVFLCRARALSPDGRCKAFDASADGYGRGEGCGVVVLKRLTDAQAAGDDILAVIRGSAVNHNGPSSGLTVPSGQAQQALLRQALAAARLDPSELDYLEAHGTGTSLGDPIEVNGLAAVLGKGRSAGRPLLIGSVKTNIGHLEAAAGIAGLIKVVLALRHGTIPASLHLRQPNPAIPWEESGVAVARQRTAWPARDRPRVAGVSSFGISGTNAHVILSAPPAAAAAAAREDATARPLHLFTLSARTREALLDHARRLEGSLAREDAPGIANACFTANAGRAQHGVRLALLCKDVAGLRKGLAAVQAGRQAEDLFEGAPPAEPHPPLAWLFTGQGSQYAGMGRELYQTQPGFRRILDECDAMLRPDLSPSLLEAWFASDRDGGLLNETAYTQPALFVLQYALAELWASWGIEPAALLGHSVGEFAAACRAGVFSLEDGLRLIAARGRLMQALPRHGMMAAVAADQARVSAALAAGGGQVSIAAVNGPRNTVVSGARAAVEAVVGELLRAGVTAQPLRTSHAFHSPLIEGMLGEFAEVAARVRMSPPRLPLLSNVTGEPADEEIATPDYWCRHARRPVQFAPGLAALVRRGCGAFLEIGPAPVLLGMGRQAVVADDALWLPSLRPGLSDWRQMLRSLAALYTRGVAIDWKGFDRDYGRRRVHLPTYPFQRQRFWVEGRGAARAPEAEVSPDWLYRVDWQPAPALATDTAGGAAPAAGCWLLLADRAGVAQRLAEVLERRGDRCLLVHREEGAPDAVNPEPLRRRIAAFQEQVGLPLRGALHLWGLDAPAAEAEETVACGAGLALVQALAGLPAAAGAARLWFVTRSAVPAGDPSQRLNLRQSALWGLGKSIALEHPELWGGLIDLDALPSEDEPLRVLAELEGSDGENQVALRGGERRVPRLAPCGPMRDGDWGRIRADATYLVTGGLGAIGLELARWLARRGATHLVLAGRSAPSADAQAEIARLEGMGAKLRCALVDVADRDAMARLLEEVAAQMPPLRGVFHAAGTGGYRPLEEMDPGTLAAALRPKVAGTLVLDELTSGLDLDAFVCFSSIASLWGAKGQAHYAAANQFLDAFAHDRRARGLPALAVNWGPWSAGGMASREARDLLGRMGIRALGAQRNLAALSRLLATDLCQAAAVDVDWSVFGPLHEGRGRGRLLQRVGTPADGGRQEARPVGGRPPLLQRLQEADAGRRHGLLVAHLQEQLAQILGFPEGRLPDPREGFFQLGMDSLMALELRSRLAKGLGQTLPAALLFDFPTAEALAGALLAQLDRDAPEVSEAGPAAAAPRRPAAEAAEREPIAIVGMACRFPGGADDPERFWRLLREGHDATRRIPAERWDADAYYDPDAQAPGTAYTRHGAFIDGVELFDAQFFGITPREAAEMDPQHRLLLEVSHAALEDGGHPQRAGAAADRTGVFVGLTNGEYALLLRGDGSPGRIGSYYVTGNSLNAAAGRVSYALGLKGPSLVVDTACSSSLVAVHLACRSLWSRECDAAIAAGANLILTPDGMVAACQARMLSPDGRCKTFDAAADGYGRGEGCGAVALKRLSDVGAGERVWALIRGTAVNQDGRSGGFTVPNGLSQQAVLREALEHAGVRREEVGYVEAHGTGTALGDPIEVGALGAVLGEGRPGGSPLLVGSVKANIGHLESAAGIAGLIKAALVVHHGEIPRQPHLRTPNPEIAWDKLGVRAATEHATWLGGGRRVAGVSSFGLSGTNAHLILEGPREAAPPAAPRCDAPAHLLAVSAKTPEALRRLAGALAGHLEAHPSLPLGDVCLTTNARSLHPVRAAWVVASLDEARNGLRALASRDAAAPGTDGARRPPRIALLFGDEGTACAGMGRVLHATQPAFRHAMDRVAAMLGDSLPRPLPEVIFAEDSTWLRDPAWTWPATFALGYALAELWASWGIRPDLVTGQGAGEYAAACVAGLLGLEEGLRLCVERGRSSAPRPAGAGVGAASTRGAAQASRIGFVSGTSGELDGAGLASLLRGRDAAAPPRLAAAMTSLRREGCDVFLEIGARPHLLDAARRCSPDGGGDALWLPSLEPGSVAWRRMLDSLAALYRRGAAVDLRGVGCGAQHRIVFLPTYPLERRRHWLPAAAGDRGSVRRSAGGGEPPSPAAGTPLGRRLRSAVEREEIEYEALLGPSLLPFLDDHRVFGAMLLPSSVYLEMALLAARDLLGDGPVVVADYEIRQAAILDPQRERAMHLVLRPRAEGGYGFQILGSDGDTDRWMCHASGTLRPAPTPAPAADDPLPALRSRLTREVPVAAFYDRLRRHGVEFGARFRALEGLWAGDGEALGEVRLPPSSDGAGPRAFRAHPVLMDACFQILGAALGMASEEVTFLQAGIERLTLHIPPGRHVFGHARLLGPAPLRRGDLPRADIRLFGPDGALVATVEGLRLKPASRPDPANAAEEPPARDLYEVEWHAQPLGEEPGAVPSSEELRAALADRILELRAGPDLAGYGEAVAAIEAFCAEAAARALHELGWGPEDAHGYTTEEAARRFEVAPRQRRLLRRLLAVLAEEGWLTAEAGRWRMRRMPAIGGASHPALERLQRHHPEAAAELDLLGRTSERLAQVLRGRCDPQELLFPGGEAESLRRLYAESPVAAAMNSLVERAVASVVARWPEGQALRVLEIGAGTGATTARLLPRLASRCSDYVFSDVSDVFTLRAAEDLRAYPFLRCELLDIERDPVGQGFAAGQFDLVVAANVLHATRNLAQTLRHVLQLLAPGGLLVLLEGTGPLRFLDLTFGLLEGWWRFDGDPARQDYPLIGAGRWRALLEANGFGEVCEVSSGSLGPGTLPPQAVMTVRAVAAPPAQDRSEAAGQWLVFADRGGIGAELSCLLRSRGAAASLVGRGDELAAADASVAQDLPAEYRRVLQGALAGGAAPLRGVVHLWSLDAELAEDSGPDALRLGAERGCRSALCLAQAMLDTPGAQAAPLYLVTRGAVAASADHAAEGHSPSGLVQAPVWGLGKVLASEHRELRCRMLDLDPAPGGADAAALLTELRAGAEPEERRVAIRAGRRRMARLVRSRAARRGRFEPRPDRSYLVTGGFGGIGLRVAGWLVEQGARNLALLGRGGASAAAEDAVRRLAESGARILPVQADVSRHDQLAAALERVRTTLPPLAGVVHAAGVVADRLIPDQEWRLFEEVFAPKIHGAWNLHRLTRHMPLDAFVLFSSASTILGGSGLANYVAANEFLDALAAHRRRLGLPGLSIAWGPWAEVGMARRVGEAREAEWRAIGMRPLPPAEALAALSDALCGEAAQLGAMSVDWARLRDHPTSAALGGLLDQLGPRHAARRATPRPSVRAEIEAAPPGEGPALLLAHVRAEVEAVLGWDPNECLDATQGFFDLGMDSLQANELRNRLQGSLGCALPTSLVFRFPTAAALADHLAREILGAAAGDGPPHAGMADPRHGGIATEEAPSPAATEAAIRRELGRLEQLLGSA